MFLPLPLSFSLSPPPTSLFSDLLFSSNVCCKFEPRLHCTLNFTCSIQLIFPLNLIRCSIQLILPSPFSAALKKSQWQGFLLVFVLSGKAILPWLLSGNLFTYFIQCFHFHVAWVQYSSVNYILPTTQALVSFLNSSKFRGPQLKKNGNEWIIKHNLFKNCNLQFNLMKMLLMSEILKILRFLKFVFSSRHLNL